MSEAEIKAILGDERLHPAWKAFIQEMQNKNYGFDPLLQAWGFFKSGWEALEAKLRAQATDDWCNSQ